jgi:hypothetical protein
LKKAIRIFQFARIHHARGWDQQNKNQGGEMKRKTMKQTNPIKLALRALIAAARVRWLRAHGHYHNTRLAMTQTQPGCVRLANLFEGTHDGNITKAVDVAITERFLLAKVGAASNTVNIAGAADTPIGVITDEAAAAGEIVNVALFGSARSTLRMVASGAIAQGALLEPAASGRVQTLTGTVGTHHVVGRALDAAANAGDVIEVDPHYFLRVI